MMKCMLACATTWTVLFAIHPATPAQQPGKAAAARFTPLLPVTPATIINSAVAYPGGNYDVDNIVDGVADGSRDSEYSSAGKGTGTFIDFDFGKPVRVAAFKHVDRFDPATVDKAKLVFSDVPDFSNVIATITVDHANTRGGATCATFDVPPARYVRWQVTALGPKGHGTVGGSEISFLEAGEPEASPSRITIEGTASPAILKTDGRQLRPVELTIGYPYAEPVEATLEISGSEPTTVELSLGSHVVGARVPAAGGDATVGIALKIAGRPVARRELALGPVRHWTMYLLPHSHVDIGFTHVQTEVQKMQWSYFEQAIELSRRTADYPPEARFKWNSEVLWAVDSYLRQASPERRQEFIEAVRKGWIHLDGLYGNELTALCRPEELFRLLDCARRLSKQYDLTIDTAMISDVPGYTWGIVPALAQSGIKYFSIGPNHCHRIGHTLAEWGDRPFYWVSPSGEHKVLCWMAGHAYSWFHGGLLGRVKKVQPRSLLEYLDELASSGYPYDMVQLRYSIGGDNGPPDPDLPEFVKSWNNKYVWPKLAIATTSELMHEFEHRYGDKAPEVRGDFTPYWEDGAGSSSQETAETRTAAERLVQAETLWAMLDPEGYPDEGFYAAWRNVILYNEHTWGAHCSISQPDSQFTLDQWQIKQAFALDAGSQSRKLLDSALSDCRGKAEKVVAIDVYNTASWPRTDLVVLPADVPIAGDVVKDSDGRTVASQRLSTGRLAFLAGGVPPLGAKRFLFQAGDATPEGSANAEGAALGNGKISVTVDEGTGAIAGLRFNGIPLDLVNRDAGMGLNDYFYVAGRDPKEPKRNGPVKITAEDAGPLVASLAIECDAPGCRTLTRRLRVVDGLNRVDVVNLVDKEQVRDKEGVHFGFAFNVPDGVMRMDTPWAVIRPEVDQMPGACKNYFTVGRWVDVSNSDFGVTWATIDAPLVEVGAIRMDVPSPMGTDGWVKHLDPSQTFHSYVMNNYWETNYKASQEGPTTFRYSMRPHAAYDSAVATRFGIERSQPLVVVPVDPGAPLQPSLLRVEPPDVIVTSLKPSQDGKALMLRLFNATDIPQKAAVTWSDPAPKQVTLSSPREEEGAAVSGPIELPGWGIRTLRAALAK